MSVSGTEFPPDRGDDPDAVRDGFDVMDAEDIGFGDKSAHEARDRPRIALGRGVYPEDITNDGLPRDREEDGQVVAQEAFQLPIDREVVVALLRKIDSRVEDDLVVGEADGPDASETIIKEILHRGPDVVIVLARVGHLRFAHGVHDEERGPVIKTKLRVAVLHQTADVVDDVDPSGFEDRFDDLGAPGIDREERRPGSCERSRPRRQ